MLSFLIDKENCGIFNFCVGISNDVYYVYTSKTDLYRNRVLIFIWFYQT